MASNALRGTGKALALAALLLLPHVKSAAADDIDRLAQLGQIPPNMVNRHGYSDFTDPLGKFLDLLAAGALVEARALQPDACAAWLATRQMSALSGKFWVWHTKLDLDTLCAEK